MCVWTTPESEGVLWSAIQLQTLFTARILRHTNFGLVVWRMLSFQRVAEQFVPYLYLFFFPFCLRPALPSSRFLIFFQHPGETSATSSLLERTKRLKGLSWVFFSSMSLYFAEQSCKIATAKDKKTDVEVRYRSATDGGIFRWGISDIKTTFPRVWERDINSDNLLLICLIISKITQDRSFELCDICYNTVYFYVSIPLWNLHRVHIWIE